MNTYSNIRFPKRSDQVWKPIYGIVIATLFFLAFMFSYALPASSPAVPWQFYSVAGVFTITALIIAILTFDKAS